MVEGDLEVLEKQTVEYNLQEETSAEAIENKNIHILHAP